MSQLVEKIVADLRANGVPLDDAGDGWFALRGDTGAPAAFVHLTDDAVARYRDSMSDEDVDGAFGPGVTADEARHRLTLIHLEETLESGTGGVRYVIPDGGDLRVFGDAASLPTLPPGDYEWHSTPR
ncbi:hypothetical protein [Spirilliplanes yamanashiensis]|uniref:Uncharacterized protein n=1 Tax=Spirilliplanes yamanashiensis TaxID=42233 RepID=A0A8J3Y9X5_9ACTN|nr:hypothetical protein [Spirilliplanes yamanashiensis]MDP9815722.1 hypothetical protein [Spirilliplanes yamanashiensis]GIJ03977.1 hypothetical protein Sya03_33290 [Spirilliplanes yamanashiensis]